MQHVAAIGTHYTGTMTDIDGTWGWVVVTAAFCSHAITFGIVYSFGILFHSLEENFNGSKAEIAWIPSLTTGFLHSSGLLASVLVYKFGCRGVCIAGTLACSSGYILSIFAPNIYFLYVTMGTVAGCGFGLVFMPAVLMVTQYFNKYRSVACGISLSGCGIGAFIFNPLTKMLLDIYSLEGTLLILSAVILNCIPFALVFRPVTFGREQTNHTDQTDKEESHTLLTDARETSTDTKNKETGQNEPEMNNKTLIVGNERDKLNNCDELLREISEEKDEDTNGEITIQIDNPMNCRNGLDKPTSMSLVARFIVLLKRPMFVIVFVSQFHFVFGFYLPFIFIPDKAEGLGISEQVSAWVVSTIGISSICGRIALGHIADKPSVNRLLMFKMFLLISGISTTLNPLLNNIWSMLIYAVMYGVSTGFTISITSVILLDLVGLEYLADAMGLVSLFSGVGSVLGPPFAGFLYDTTGSYTAPFLTSGSSLTFSGVLMFLATVLH